MSDEPFFCMVYLAIREGDTPFLTMMSKEIILQSELK